MAVFKTKNLSFTYPNADKKALDDVNIEINSGELVLLMGETGSGKSTLLKMLKEELRPYGTLAGDINISANNIGYVSQNPDTSFVSEKVRGELAFSLENQQLSQENIAVKIGEIASFFNLTELLDKELSKLSGGEKSVVAVASAMIANADVLIMDEPFAQLDTKATYQMISLIKRVNQELGTTVLLSTHSCEGIVDICDKMIVLQQGRVIESASPKEIANNNKLLDFFPLYTKLFQERPLTVKEAILLDKKFNEKPVKHIAFDGVILEAKNVTFAYEKNQKDILNQLNFKAYKGSVHAIIGANGSGKTTLLKVLAGIKKCYGGKIKRYGKVAYLPQNVRYLFTKDTVSEEISVEVAEKFGLLENLNQHPYDLSGGQMQKLALAILSCQNFDVLLLDEPTKGLDSFNKKNLQSYIKSLTQQGKTIVLVSHDIDFVGEIADYVSFLSDSIITITGERRQVLSSLDFYTTSVRRITCGYLNNAVSTEDLQ